VKKIDARNALANGMSKAEWKRQLKEFFNPPDAQVWEDHGKIKVTKLSPAYAPFIDVENPQDTQKGHLLKVESGSEVMFVVTTFKKSIRVRRGIGALPSYVIAPGTKLVIIGYVTGEEKSNDK
jgi:hypothetical protein